MNARQNLKAPWTTMLAAAIGMGILMTACGPGGGGDTDPEPPPQPGNIYVDLKVRSVASDWTDGTAHATTDVDEWAIFMIKITNTGDGTDGIRIRQSSCTSKWRTEYYDSLAGGNKISNRVKGGGWYTPNLAPGGSKIIRMEMRPRGNAGAVGVATIYGYADNNDRVNAETTKAAGKIVDPRMRIRLTGGSWAQGVETSLDTGETANAQVSIRNEGKATGNIVVGAMSDSMDGWDVTFYDALTGGANITAQVLGAGWTRSYTKNQTRYIRFEVQPNGASGDLEMEVSGVADTAAAVGIRVLKAPGYQPDLHVNAGAGYTGDNVYSVDGTGQAAAVQASSKTQVEYLVNLQNDGDFGDTFVLTGSGFEAAWIARYFDAPTGGNEITAAVRGAGWTSPILAVGAQKVIRAVVVPGAVSDGSEMDLVLLATSQGDTDKKDAIQMQTEKTASGANAIQWKELKD